MTLFAVVPRVDADRKALSRTGEAKIRGYAINRDDYLVRLRRIEGQVRGLQHMIETDEYCIDVLTQLSAVTAALQSVAIGLVDEHLRHAS